MEKFSLIRVLFVPARNPPHKNLRSLTRYEHRFRMVEIACGPYPAFLASRLEDGDKRSYTVDTLERFRKELSPSDRLFFLIGSDAFDDLETWKRWEDVVNLTEFIVVTRPGHDYQTPKNARAHRLEGLSLPVSSSSIRSRLAAGDPTPELPEGVRQYIEKHRLYGFGRKVTASP
jgi:nicotinate-nucleotide adenylyltransferase